MDFSKAKAIVFDHDGVIIELSELAKQGAWSFVANHKDIGDRVVVAEAEEFYGRAKGNRYDVLNRVFERLGKDEKEIPELVKKHAKRFNDIVQAGIRAMGIKDADKEALLTLKDKYALYINTGTVENAMKDTLRFFGIDKCFKDIFGQPGSKTDNLKKVLEKGSIVPEEMIFIGDSDWDYEAAKEVGCSFIGRANYWNDWKNEPFPLIVSLQEILGLIK
jgi:phosphoglycolate phosphatase-like HAD superfamily hydrolase